MSSAGLPRLIAFDLDDTIWHPEMWLCSGAPFRTKPEHGGDRVFCKDGEEMHFLGDARAILRWLADPNGIFRQSGGKIVYVSRTSYPEFAFPLLDMMRLGGKFGRCFVYWVDSSNRSHNETSFLCLV